MALSGNEKTALQTFGVPGMTRSFSAKTAATVIGVVSFTSEALTQATVSSEALTQASFADEDLEN
jgi:hypothetical protein